MDEAAIAAPVSQSCDSKLLTVKLQDAYWDGEKLSLSVSVQPQGDYAFYLDTGLGADGESFDRIWPGNGNGGQPFEEWKAAYEERRAERIKRLLLPLLAMNQHH